MTSPRYALLRANVKTKLLPTLLIAAACARAQVHGVSPKSGPAPVGPYSPGVMAGDYLYVSGQGAKGADGTMPGTFEAQTRQCLENVKAVVEAAGLTMEHVVYTQVYLEDMGNFDAMNRVYAEYFPKAPPARATLGVFKLPGTPVEINAVAVRDLSEKKTVDVAGYFAGEPASAGVLTKERLYISAMRGKASGDPAAQTAGALEAMQAVVEAAGLTMANVVFVNPYLTNATPMETMNKLYAQRFEFGNTPARATIQVNALPGGAAVEFTGVAVRDVALRRAVRPKNMPPSATASPCVFAGDTLYCSAKDGFIPGPNGGIFATTTVHQLHQTMRNLLDNLEEADMGFDDIVATNVYLDDLADFQGMNQLYAKYFHGVKPARTTVQQIAPMERKAEEDGEFPALEQISFVAVRGAARR